MGSVTKTNDVERPEFVLYYHPAEPALLERFLNHAGADLKEIVFQSFEDFQRIDPALLPPSTGLKLRVPLADFTARRQELQALLPGRDVFFVVELDFAQVAADPKRLLGPLLATSAETEEVFSILVKRTQYDAFVAARDAINREFPAPVDFTLEFFEQGLDLRAEFAEWKARIAAEATTDQFHSMTLPFYNKTHNFFRRRNLFIRGNQLFLSPQVYDNLDLAVPELDVTALTPAQIHRRAQDVQTAQLQIADTFAECADCRNLLFCAGRLTLAALRELAHPACPFPEVVVQRINRE